jgi:hypothetical protein
VLAEAGLAGAAFFIVVLIGAYVYVRRRERRMERLYEEDAQSAYEESGATSPETPDRERTS